MYNPWIWTKGGNWGGRGCSGWRGIKERKLWDNCHSIINKIYFKKAQPGPGSCPEGIYPQTWRPDRGPGSPPSAVCSCRCLSTLDNIQLLFIFYQTGSDFWHYFPCLDPGSKQPQGFQLWFASVHPTGALQGCTLLSLGSAHGALTLCLADFYRSPISLTLCWCHRFDTQSSGGGCLPAITMY